MMHRTLGDDRAEFIHQDGLQHLANVVNEHNRPSLAWRIRNAAVGAVSTRVSCHVKQQAHAKAEC
jgi:hypothetical protein